MNILYLVKKVYMTNLVVIAKWFKSELFVAILLNDAETK